MREICFFMGGWGARKIFHGLNIHLKIINGQFLIMTVKQISFR